MYRILILFALVAGITTFVKAQTPATLRHTFNWSPMPLEETALSTQPVQVWHFAEAAYTERHPTLPVYTAQVSVPGNGDLSATITSVQYEPFAKPAHIDDAYLADQLRLHTSVVQDRQRFVGTVSFIPIRKIGNTYERVTSIELALNYRAKTTTAFRNPPANPYTSILQEGDVYKITVAAKGIIRMDYTFLKNLGISVDNIDPRTLKLYHNGGGMLPEANSEFRYTDLYENAIQVIGEEDGVFNGTDAVLFYCEGADKTYVNTNAKAVFNRPNNLYTDVVYFYLKVGGAAGKRIALSPAAVSNAPVTTTSYDDYQRHEEDKFNLLDYATGAQGSGKRWFGEQFKITREIDFTNKFDFSNLVNTDSVFVRMAFAGRSSVSHPVRLVIDGQNLSGTVGATFVSQINALYATGALIEKNIKLNGNTLSSIKIVYPEVAADPQTEGWLDYIDITARRQLILTGNSLQFQDLRARNYPAYGYKLGNTAADVVIWDITNPTDPALQPANQAANELDFAATGNGVVRSFYAFRPAAVQAPVSGVKIPNQNLHGINDVDLVIIYPKDFEADAERLATHRRNFNGYSVAAVPIQQVYEEFGGGAPDPTALRDFAKMLYDRNPRFKYLLLFGDGSFDYKNIGERTVTRNFIPVWETGSNRAPERDIYSSLSFVESFPTDDYFALLSTAEGEDLEGALDIAVGRLPIGTAAEAKAVVDKLMRYDTDPQTLGDWRLNMAFVGDDEEGNVHMLQANNIADVLNEQYKIFNHDKIYLDAYPQVSTPAGTRIPKATEALNNAIFKGQLVVNYMGHGGPRGWAQERVLSNTDIYDWSNHHKLPLFVTATCTFAGYDDPDFLTAGEEAFLKNDGGAIALYTTVRPVYSSGNERLTRAVFQRLCEKTNGAYSSIGEVLRTAKNANSVDTLQTNARKFTLLGDPSMYLSFPKYNIVTTKINGHAIGAGALDTIRALQKVTIEGYVADANNAVLTSFNGRVYPTIFDKETILRTLGQDPTSTVRDYKVQKNIIFKGISAVTNGHFSFTFVVPKDINYQYGVGKVSYYAENGSLDDAAGYSNDVVIGGSDPNAPADNQPPTVQVFMNNESFVIGGMTDPNPTLLVKLSDDNGINVVGNSIGHDLTGVLNQQTQNTYILNDYYTSALNSHTQGEVRYPLKDIPVGRHHIAVKAWDIANNSAEGFTEFVVADDAAGALAHVLNYPNPFTTHTEFMFEHNMASEALVIKIDIFSVSGRLVKTIEQTVMPQGFRVNGIKWDGKDDFGGQLAKGVYLYKVRVAPLATTDTTAIVESNFEKLVILK